VLVKDFNGVDDQLGFGDAYDSFGISLEGINKPVLQSIRQGRVQGKSFITGNTNKYITGLYLTGN